ncbi:MAG: homoserine O-acetyltransferase, partial [Gemmatimonadota bacterium]|nr:homoserine O-acetyltransferase [Gemmatimonadota bacterium]
DSFHMAYESWGRPDAPGGTVLLVHFLTSDTHATGEYDGTPRGWWEDLVGPGRAIDTDRFFVVCPNLLGGCHGSTGPRFPAPDGDAWLDRFPLLTPRDLQRAQRLFLHEIGAGKPTLVVGPSMGGMIAWEWAADPGAAERVVSVAAPAVASPHQIGLNWLQRRAIALDGTEGETPASRRGQAVARGVGMLGYRAPEGLWEKFGRSWFREPGPDLASPGLFNVESWLHHHGRKLPKKFDARTWRLFARAMDLHDTGEGRGGVARAFSEDGTAEFLAVGISSDHLYPAAEIRRSAKEAGATYREIESPHGHDAFLLETDALAGLLADFLA